MIPNRYCSDNSGQRGFSLLELLIGLIILLIVMGTVFQVVDLALERSAAEQGKLDMFQGAREFMDQMSRDLRQAGYPGPRNFGAGLLTEPIPEDSRAAVGLVKVAAGELWFEGDMDGQGNVSVVRYFLDTSTTNNCPCLKRSQLDKVDGSPFTGQTSPAYQVEVQGVQNANIFTAFANGAAVTLPVDFDNDPDTIATVDTIQVILTLRSVTLDPGTGLRPLTTLVSSVRLPNCSQAVTGAAMSCQ
jgi:prepilin-type N-terminal cleavage/methylation domain-containing protein